MQVELTNEEALTILQLIDGGAFKGVQANRLLVSLTDKLLPLVEAVNEPTAAFLAGLAPLPPLPPGLRPSPEEQEAGMDEAAEEPA